MLQFNIDVSTALIAIVVHWLGKYLYNSIRKWNCGFERPFDPFISYRDHQLWEDAYRAGKSESSEELNTLRRLIAKISTSSSSAENKL